MGYDLTIVRQNDWSDFEEDSNITLEEWLQYVESDPELQLTNGYDSEVPGILPGEWQNRPGFCDWVGHPKADAAIVPWFDYYLGSINTKNPDDNTIRKMIMIAKKLNGKVRGDDGEFYDESYFTNGGYPIEDTNSDETINNLKTTSNKKPWWKFW